MLVEASGYTLFFWSCQTALNKKLMLLYKRNTLKSTQPRWYYSNSIQSWKCHITLVCSVISSPTNQSKQFCLILFFYDLLQVVNQSFSRLDCLYYVSQYNSYQVEYDMSKRIKPWYLLNVYHLYTLYTYTKMFSKYFKRILRMFPRMAIL